MPNFKEYQEKTDRVIPVVVLTQGLMPRRITTAERRARLAVRHRLAPSARVDDDLVAVARSVVALHATDPATVVLSAMARMRTPDPTAVERALYDDVVLVRMMAMRRTIFTCAVEDAALLQRSSADAVAANERKKLLALLEQQAVSDDPTAWLATTPRPRRWPRWRRPGEAAATELTKAVPELATRVTAGPGHQARRHHRAVLPGAQPDGHGGAARARPAQGAVDEQPAPLGVRSRLGSAPRWRPSRSTRRASSSSAGGSIASDRARSPT